MKGYNLWNPVTKNIVYNRYVVFREVKEVPIQEVTLMEKELEKIEFELEVKNLTQRNKLNQKKKNLIPQF